MTERAAGSNRKRPGDIEALPWWAQPGKLVWFGLTGGLGCGLMLLASLGVALARALAELMGGSHGLALGLLEVTLAAMLVIPAHRALVLFLRNELDHSRDRQTSAQQVPGDPSRCFRMSNEAFFVIGCLGLIAGNSIGYGIGAFLIGAILGLASRKEALETLLPLSLSFVPLLGIYSLGALFFLTRGTDEPNSEEESSQDE